MRAWVVLVLLLAGACAARPPSPSVDAAALPRDISCVPFARALSGIALSGDAHRWWAVARGRYTRASAPKPGAVLVLQRSRRLPQGHVAVVVEQIGPREMLVTHANWASGADKGRVAENQRVIDVSRRNDWSAVRVWHAPSNSLGITVYAAYGFIHPPRAADPVALAAAVPSAAQAASGTL